MHRNLARIALFAALGFGSSVAPSAHAQTAGFSAAYHAHDTWAWWGDSCRINAPVEGQEPAADGSFPVFIWLSGTGAEGGWSGNTLTTRYDMALAKATVKAAAESGFVAAYPIYKGAHTVGVDQGQDRQALCMFNRTRASTSALDVICARPKADCSRIVVAGHSQGGMIAMRAANHSSSIRAAYATSVFSLGCSNDAAFWRSRESGGQRALPNGRLRIATGRGDMDAWWVPCHRPGDYSALRTFTGLACDNGTVSCNGAAGPGWTIVQHAAPPTGPTDKYADHCFTGQNQTMCKEPQPVDSYWIEGAAPWTLKSALGWLKTYTG
jgi:pimeloyl-ACP methyl ester carboxylesterase